MRLYLAGPMAGVPNFQEVFKEYAEKLRDDGYDVVSPAEITYPHYSEYDYLRIDLFHVMNVDGVAVIPNWKDSKGVFCEIVVAMSIGIPVFDADTMEEFDFHKPCWSDLRFQ